MPIYEYRCERGHTFEAMQRIAEDPLTSCSTCEAPAQRVFYPVAVHFKGSGFYTTDYARKKGAGNSSDSDSKRDGKETSSSSDSGSTKAGGDGSKPD